MKKEIRIRKSTRFSKALAKMDFKVHTAMVVVLRIIETALLSGISIKFAQIIANLGDITELKHSILVELILEVALCIIATVSHASTHVLCNKYHNIMDEKYYKKLDSTKLTGMNTGSLQSYIDKVVTKKRSMVEDSIKMPAILAPFFAVVYKMASNGCGKIMLIPIVSLLGAAGVGVLCGMIRYTENAERCGKLRGLKTDLMLNVKTLRFLGKTEFAEESIKNAQDACIPFGCKILRMSGYELSYLVFYVPTVLSSLLIPDESRLEIGALLLTSVSSFVGSVNFMLNFVDNISEMKENEVHIKCLDNVDTRYSRKEEHQKQTCTQQLQMRI